MFVTIKPFRIPYFQIYLNLNLLLLLVTLNLSVNGLPLSKRATKTECKNSDIKCDGLGSADAELPTFSQALLSFSSKALSNFALFSDYDNPTSLLTSSTTTISTSTFSIEDISTVLDNSTTTSTTPSLPTSVKCSLDGNSQLSAFFLDVMNLPHWKLSSGNAIYGFTADQNSEILSASTANCSNAIYSAKITLSGDSEAGIGFRESSKFQTLVDSESHSLSLYQTNGQSQTLLAREEAPIVSSFSFSFTLTVKDYPTAGITEISLNNKPTLTFESTAQAIQNGMFSFIVKRGSARFEDLEIRPL